MITNKIRERLARNLPTFSFEFFPPKNEKGGESLRKALETVVSLDPVFVSVTYGAGGSTREKTQEIVCSIQKDYGLDTMAHVTCIGHTERELRELLADYAAAGISDILALRGDLPKDSEPVAGGPEHAVDLIRLAREVSDFGVMVAGFPEKHPEAPSMESDLKYLKDKVDAGAEAVITQLFFDNDLYFDYVEKARAMGVTAPIIPGVMPITKASQIDRFTELCGCYIPESLKQQMLGHGEDEIRVQEIGLAYCAAQCVDLLRRGAPGIHFYTLNQSRAAQTVFAALQAMGWRD